MAAVLLRSIVRLIHSELEISGVAVTFFGEAPVDSSSDVNEVHRLDARVILGLHSLIENEEVVAVDSSA